MAVTGSKKALSKEHEEYVASRYGGRRSPSSGAAFTDIGDVRGADLLFECKGKFGIRTGEKPVRSTLVTQFEKVADEAWQSSHTPAMALRFYMPDSPLANNLGYVDLVLKLLEDDLSLSEDAYQAGREDEQNYQNGRVA